MPRRLLFALLLLVAAPLALLGWLSASAYRQQQETAREQLEAIFQSRLGEIDRSLSFVFDGYARELDGSVARSGDTIESLRKLDSQSPIVRACFYVDERGLVLYPPKPSGDGAERISLHASLPALVQSKPDLVGPSMLDDSPPTEHSAPSTTDKASGWLSRAFGSRGRANKSTTTAPAVKTPPAKSAIAKQVPEISSRAARIRSGEGTWQTWYMDEGIQLIYWMPRNQGDAVGVLLERARWVSDLTAALPDSTPFRNTEKSTVSTSGFTALTDESQQIVYRWGDNGPRLDSALARRSLSPPLSSWQLEYHSDDPLSGSASLPLVVSLAGIGVVLLSLGAYVLTGVQRQMRAARNRVNFASQVSHELRTPLTNIRLYAELAESDLAKLPESQGRSSIEKRLQVIETESRRLGRLVSGVLEMIRDHRKPAGPKIVPAVPDEVVDQTIEQFKPSFQNAGLQVERDAHAGNRVGLDADILEMILVNLLSNVEKYAGDGGSVRVASSMDGNNLVVRVADQGPGIARRHRRSIFRPFLRLDDSISAPSGTGIGLTIARRLARRHGGELELLSQHAPTRGTTPDRDAAGSAPGACFELTLPTEPVAQDKEP